MRWPAVSVGLLGSNRGSDGRGNGSSREIVVYSVLVVHTTHTLGRGGGTRVTAAVRAAHVHSVSMNLHVWEGGPDVT